MKKILSVGCAASLFETAVISPLTLAVICLVFLFTGCSPKPRERETSFFAASWNLQAMFDGIDKGNEYSEYRQQAGWTEEKYRARLNAVIGAIKSMDFPQEGDSGKAASPAKGPGLIVLVEIENAEILSELAAALDYGWTVFAALPGSSLGVAAMSRFPIIGAKAHSVHFYGSTAPRPVAEVQIDADGERLVFLACHWKSKRGGEAETESVRRSEAALVSRLLAETWAAAPEAPVIVMGDLNENHDEFIRARYRCALMPDTEDAAASAPEEVDAPAPAKKSRKKGKRAATPLVFTSARPGFQDFLVLSGAKPPRLEYLDKANRTGEADKPDYADINAASVLYSPWLDADTGAGSVDADSAAAGTAGSYYYRERWETIDHILLNGAAFDQKGWDFAGFRAAAGTPWTGAEGQPAAYSAGTGNGLSDHLPVLVRLERRP